jgi:pimeloyl-ACP methyl ester carboxylesterase
VVTVDLAGHGASGLNRNGWTMAAFGQDVVAVVEQLGLTQTVLIGHSMGGPVIVEAAWHMPSRVLGLVGADTLSNPERNRTQADIKARVAPLQADFRQAARAFVRAGMFVPTSDRVWRQRHLMWALGRCTG